MLRVLDLLFQRRFASLRRIPFDRIAVEFTSGESVIIDRESIEVEDSPTPGIHSTGRQARTRIVLSASLDGVESTGPELIPVRELRPGRDLPLAAIEDLVPSLERVGPEQWLDRSTNQILNFEDVAETYGQHLPPSPNAELPVWLDDMLQSLSVDMIETQRLSEPAIVTTRYRHDTPTTVSTVQRLSEDLAIQIRKALAEYAEVSQRLDRTFPNRLLGNVKPPKEATEDTIRARYEIQGRTRGHLIAAGLLDSGEEIVLPTRILKASERTVLWTYLGDVDAKLEVLQPIADKIDLLLDILNSKYVSKSLEIQRREGFLVRTVNGEVLNPDFLSSGEQHELVLTYRLLFGVDPGSVILIDEPELSLHVTWQKMFLSDLLRISKIARLEFIVATHSPAIIGNRWDLTKELSSIS